MILSASRRTDIPACYSEWFFHRIKEGYLDVRNPMNPHQISRIELSPRVVDCIVFWTKNPGPMLDRLEELRDYTYYFQFTLTGYGRDMEPNLPDKEKVMIPLFRELASRLGKERVIWRYDPILFSPKYSIDDHLKTFEKYSRLLCGCTEKCVISFLDLYAKNKRSMEAAGCRDLRSEELQLFAEQIAGMARVNGMVMAACSEEIDLKACGIVPNRCVDQELIERLTGYRIKAGKDKGQRPACGCIESVEIGAYDTCRNGCKYCYANLNPAAVRYHLNLYDPRSPLLCSEPVGPRDKVTRRKVVSLKGEPLNGPRQMSLFES